MIISEWRFDVANPHERSFEESLLTVAHNAAVVDMIKIKCNEIRKDPKAYFRGVVQGRFVYIAKTGPVKELNVEPLLVVYTLDEPNKKIQRVFVCKAASVGESSHPPTMTTMSETLKRAIEAALRHAAHGSRS